MTVTWELDEDVLADLRAEAARRGLSVEAVATERLRGRRRDTDDLLAEAGFGETAARRAELDAEFAADADIAAGRVAFFATAEELFADLNDDL
jgi:hypothetical protein